MRRPSSRGDFSRSSISAFYWPPESKDTIDVTQHITGCENECSLKTFTNRSEIYKAKPSLEEYCQNTNFNNNYSSSSKAIKPLMLISYCSFLVLIIFMLWQ
ncbi:unnamed protein product [Meloidogyne enterolobii]|uniref:Uncharacterized protein n=1 Tax=Meloidogyne enterolobii TaxID=390850 RepID=A0ACB0YCJ2_MELEN